MVQVSLHEAEANLSRLIRQALTGEEIIIADGKKTFGQVGASCEIEVRKKNWRGSGID
jgi:hypothetical protein